MVKLARGDWVIVCDGQKALFLINAGSAVAPTLEVREEFQVENPPTSAQGTDAPGRTFQSANARRSAVDQTDWHDQAEQQFLAGIAERLDRVATGGGGKITLVAPPRALGMIRNALSPAVKSAIQAEVARDYVMMPVAEITRLLSD
jgi:protein required for attachment to host cells